LFSKKARILFNFKAVILLLFVFFLPLQIFSQQQAVQVCLNKTTLNATLATNPREWQKGLMYRASLPMDQAMLFIFPEERTPGFWMKNMRFPLDIIWIDKHKKIIDIDTDVPICENNCPALSPVSAVLYVLEVNAGFCVKNGIQIGMAVDF
jgi:hypothetical protein